MLNQSRMQCQRELILYLWYYSITFHWVVSMLSPAHCPTTLTCWQLENKNYYYNYTFHRHIYPACAEHCVQILQYQAAVLLHCICLCFVNHQHYGRCDNTPTNQYSTGLVITVMTASIGLPEYEHYEVCQLARSKANPPSNPAVWNRFAMVILTWFPPSSSCFWHYFYICCHVLK